MSRYAKGIAAVLGAVAASVGTAAAGATTAQVITAAVAAGAGALAVVLVPNKTKS